MKPLAPRFDELQKLLDGANSIVVTGHERPDGDAVGAIGALRRHLERCDKSVLALLSEPMSDRYGFMRFRDRYEVYDAATHDEAIESADVFVMVDLSAISRLGPIAAPVARGGAQLVCIDHHPCEGDGPGDLNLLDTTATATGRIVWDYLTHVGADIDREIAECVFVSLCTDTGWFRYSNTTPDVLGLASELADYRLDLPGIYRAIYQSNSTPMLRLLGQVVRATHEECDGRFLWSRVRRELVESLGVERLDADPILDVLRSGVDVEVVALFIEGADGDVQVSLRSRPGFDVNAVARAFGGGGHTYAAGAAFPSESASDRIREMVATIRHAIRASVP